MITLSKVKIHPDMSEETRCFSATICHEGKPVGTVKNDGRGGCHMYYWDNREAGKKIEEWADKQEMEFDFERLDQMVDRILAKQEEQKQLKRWCKKETLFRFKGDKNGEWRTVKSPFTPAVKAFLVKKYSDLERIANEEL